MPVLVRYCLTAIWPLFFLATGCWLFILNLLFYLLQFLRYLLEYQAGVANSFLLLLYIQPGFLVLAIPIGFLTALLIVYGRLSADGEVTAVESCGFSLWILVWPMIGVSILFSVFLVVFMDTLLPWGNTSYLKLEYKIITERSAVIVKERVFINSFEGYTLYADQKNDQNDTLKNVMVFVLNEKGYPYRTIYASKGKIFQDAKNFHVFLGLDDGNMQQVSEKKSETIFDKFFQMKFKSCVLDLSANHLRNGPVDFSDSRNISMKELALRIKRKKNEKQDTRYDESEFQKKFSIPFSALAFAFIGIPLGLIARTGSLAGPFLAVVLVVIYQLFIMFGEAGGPMGVISPFEAMWLPNAVLVSIGALLIYGLNNKHDFWKGLFRKKSNRTETSNGSGPQNLITPE